MLLSHVVNETLRQHAFMPTGGTGQARWAWTLLLAFG